MSEVEPAFEVLDALDGFCHLERRDRTLDGSVPLRVAQGCVPFMEGNAFGFQVVLSHDLRIERRLHGWSILSVHPSEKLQAAITGAIPRLRAQGFLNAVWGRVLAGGVAWSEGGIWGSRIRLWTGLLVRPLRDLWLRVSCPTNRRNVRVNMEIQYIENNEFFTPLVLDFSPIGSAPLRLSGEIATIAPVAPRAVFEQVRLEQAKEIGEAHGAFYDASYFETKKGEITKKYRKLIRTQLIKEEPTTAFCRVVEAGPSAHSIQPVQSFLGPEGTHSYVASSAEKLQEVLFRNLVSFRVSFDGYSVVIDPDRDELDAGTKEVEACFAAAMGPLFQQEHRGALWYLTKYFTPHPPGEAHFFLKPWAFVTTPPGWSCLLDGVHGDGYDVLRGVISTDQFHATPAVFTVYKLHTMIDIPRRTPLLRVLPVPRSLLSAGFREVSFLDMR